MIILKDFVVIDIIKAIRIAFQFNPKSSFHVCTSIKQQRYQNYILINFNL